MATNVNRQWVLDRTPEGAITPDVFTWREGAMPEPKAGEALVRLRTLSIDPAQRAWMRGKTYKDQVMPGDVMHGFAIGEIIRSDDPAFTPGALVEGMLGWQDYVAVPTRTLTLRDSSVSPEHLIGVLSITGLTAYYGLLDVGRIKAGDTVVISAAAGAVGSIAGQIARIAGCRVIGVAGGADKCAWIVNDLGFEAAADYKAGKVNAQLRALCPNGIDVYFDNVGGEVLEAALLNMKQGGRIVCCGAVSAYDQAGAPAGTPFLPGILISKRLHMSGFIVMDHFATRPEAEARLKAWIASGEIKPVVDLDEGLENAPAALIKLLAGGNRGKAAVRVA